MDNKPKFMCKLQIIKGQNIKANRFLFLFNDKIVINKQNDQQLRERTLYFSNLTISILWEYKNKETIGFQIREQTNQKKNSKILKYIGESNTLNILKQYLNGRIFYENISDSYQYLENIIKRNNTFLYTCKNIVSGTIKLCKQIKLDKTLDLKSNQEIRIIMILNQFPHKNILTIDEMFIDKEYVYFIMEYCQGGTLFHYFQNKNFILDQNEIRIIIKRLLKAIKHLHDMGIMHRDLKLDNVMFSKENDIKSIKIIDFGLSTEILQNDQIKCGTPGYIAPEILNNEYYCELCDIYSLGSIFHSLLSGQKLYPQYSTLTTLYQMNKLNQYRISHRIQNKDEISLIQKMLAFQNQRLTAEQCLESTYFQKHKNNNNNTIEDKMRIINFPQLKNPFSQTFIDYND